MICKGTHAIFEFEGGGAITPPASYGLLHDPTGKTRSSRHVFCGPFEHAGERVDQDEVPKDARAYLGRKHVVKGGSADLPPRSAKWDVVGDLKTIYYKRGGTKAPGKYRHEFNKPRGTFIIVHAIKGHGTVSLWKHGNWYAVVFPRGAMIDDRGFVWP